MGYPTVYPTGVTVFDPERAYAGYTLFQASGDGALLMLERPHEVIVPRIDVKTFRVPGAAPNGRHRTVELRNISSAPVDEGALCVPAETPIPLSAGG